MYCSAMKGANIKCLSYENIYQKYSLNKKMPVCFWCVFEVFKSIYDIMLEGFFCNITSIRLKSLKSWKSIQLETHWEVKLTFLLLVVLETSGTSLPLNSYSFFLLIKKNYTGVSFQYLREKIPLTVVARFGTTAGNRS